MAWPCFWVERNGRAAVELRRYVTGRDSEGNVTPDEHKCPGKYGYHNACIDLPRTIKLRLHGTEGFIDSLPLNAYRSRHKAKWPTRCDYCPYEFVPDDQWQAGQEPIYVRPDTGETWKQRDLPIGAMYDGFWDPFGKGDDGISLFVTLPKPDPDRPGEWKPDHWWHVDGPARNHEGGMKPNAWKRTGDVKAVPAVVTATPSILTSHYHGFLTNGSLTDPC